MSSNNNKSDGQDKDDGYLHIQSKKHTPSIVVSRKRFDITTLPDDIQRIYHKLVKEHHGDEDYALVFCFMVRTGVELHRAWHLTLLTTKILTRLKETFGIRCHWRLGVLKLTFSVDDGAHELYRKVPYDYDSEYQDLYFRLAEALCEGHISIHQALIFQSEIKQGLHTAPSGLFFRRPPGRLLLYPLEAATCAVIFFDGDWVDAGVAAVCGFTAGCIEWALSATSDYFGSAEVKVLVDVLAAGVTGIIGGIFYRYVEYNFCLSAIFLGTLYWFFYGTAFVLGLLEIVAGELETGVTRFIAVVVKTFVLTLSSAVGLMVVVEDAVYPVWIKSTTKGACGTIDLNEQWWRIPLYLLCSAAALGQYRMPLANYWRALIVQFCAYEVQYQVKQHLEPLHPIDFLDQAAANFAAAMAAVVSASVLQWLCDTVGEVYISKLLDEDPPDSCFSNCLYSCKIGWMKIVHYCGMGRKSGKAKLELSTEQFGENSQSESIRLSPEKESALIEAIVESNGLNLWSLLMPALYQLVPGAMLANNWYNVIFPLPLQVNNQTDTATGITFYDSHMNPQSAQVAYGLWVVSLSLALGMIIGNTVVSIWVLLYRSVSSCCRLGYDPNKSRLSKERFMQQGIMEASYDDPSDDMGGRTDKKTDEPIRFNVSSDSSEQKQGTEVSFTPESKRIAMQVPEAVEVTSLSNGDDRV